MAASVVTGAARINLDVAQQQVAAAIAGGPDLVLVEGAAGAGKTSTLAAARLLLEASGGSRMVVVSPTLKAASVAGREIGTEAFSAAWLVHQHGFRWDEDGRWGRLAAVPQPRARLVAGDVLVVDEAGMLDQDTALALVRIADEAGARLTLVGDRHQLPAVGRGGVLDLAADAAPEQARLSLEAVHRFADPDYADLSLRMRTGQDPAAVFDALLARGDIQIHPSDTERLHHLANEIEPAVDAAGGSASDDGQAGRALIVADTREQVAALNAAIRDRHLTAGHSNPRGAVTTSAGERLGVGDTVTTRRNDRSLGVANRETWTVTGISPDGSLTITREPGDRGRNAAGAQGGTQSAKRASAQVTRGERTLPAAYVEAHVELAYARTVYGAQGETVDRAHFVLGEQTGAASAYVAMTRGRHANTAHLVAETVEDAREQWIGVFSRDRADLGPARAATTAAEDLERYGSLPHRPNPAAEMDWESAEALQVTHAARTPNPRRDTETMPAEPVRRGPAR